MKIFSIRVGRLLFILQTLTAILLVNIGFLLAVLGKIYIGGGQNVHVSFKEMIPVLSILAVIFLNIYGVLDIGKRNLAEIIYSALIALLFINLCTIVLQFFFASLKVDMLTVLAAFILQFALLVLWAYSSDSFYYIVNPPLKSALIYSEAGAVHEYLEKVGKRNMNYRIAHMCKYSEKEIFSIISGCDAVFITDIPPDARESIIEFSANLGKEIFIVPKLYEISVKNASMMQVEDIPVFRCKRLGLTVEQRMIKRLFDIAFSLIGVVLTLPLMAAAAALVRIQDGGPALFSQERVTVHNRKFRLYKFRTMVMDAEKYMGPVLAEENDTRITPVGRVMRRLRIDELPQLFNVLLGDMSIVGPRPEREFFIKQYIEEVPEFKYRVKVKAGLTGMAQVLGKYNTTPSDKLKYDLLYMQNFSFLLDLKIIMQTVKILFMKTSTQGVKKNNLKRKEGREQMQIQVGK